jgi:hypothetical protein
MENNMKTITLTRPAPYPFGGKFLVPGDNRVDDEYIAELMANPVALQDISAGILVIGHGKPVELDTQEPAPVPAPAPSDDLEDLRALAAGDGRRKDVQEARAKLAELEDDGA